jgi:hypothetical protein
VSVQVAAFHLINAILSHGHYLPDNVQHLLHLMTEHVRPLPFSYASYSALLELLLGLSPCEMNSWVTCVDQMVTHIVNKQTSEWCPLPVSDVITATPATTASTISSTTASRLPMLQRSVRVIHVIQPLLSLVTSQTSTVPLSFALTDLVHILQASKDNCIKSVRVHGWQNHILSLADWLLMTKPWSDNKSTTTSSKTEPTLTITPVSTTNT